MTKLYQCKETQCNNNISNKEINIINKENKYLLQFSVSTEDKVVTTVCKEQQMRNTQHIVDLVSIIKYC